MSDSEDEFCEYGNALDVLDEDNLPRKKPFSLNDQTVKDKHGRRRFHGAFTGGFSAGFFNSVGSLEGWTPSEFKSSRSEKTEKKQQRPEDFMDEEDLDEFGIAPRVLRATSDYSDGSKKRSRKSQFSDGPIPGVPVLEQLLQPARETVGVKLLKKMGWRPGQGTGPRLSRMEKKRVQEESKMIAAKVYGCSLPRDVSDKKDCDAESTVSTDDENDEDLTFAPDDFEPFLCEPKVNCFGIGYSGLARSHIDLFAPTPLRMEEKKKKVLISGQAFGVGAFEEDDEDIYAKEDMSRYDFTLETSKPTTSKWEKQSSSVDIVDYFGDVLAGFILAKNSTIKKKHFPPPWLPRGYEPVYVTNKSVFEPRVDKVRVATDRARLLKEPESSPERTKESKDVKTSGVFRPFAAFPEKQQRYEKFLSLSQLGQKDRLSYFQPLTMTDWEKEQERMEFEQAARLYQPLTGAMSDRFVSASEPEDFNNPLPSFNKTVSKKSEQQAAAEMKMFGRLTREETDWRPCSLLCKRFNLPELYRGDGESSNSVQSKTSKYSVFNFLDSLNYRLPQKHEENPELEVPVDEPETSEPRHRGADTEPDVPLYKPMATSVAETSGAEFPDPPPKVDLFKAIFLSSSEDSSSGGDDDDDDDEPQGDVSKAVNAQRNTSAPTGVFANLDLDAINQHKKVKSSDDVEKQRRNASEAINSDRNMSTPSGLFANLDLDAINQRRKVKSSDEERKSGDTLDAVNTHVDTSAPISVNTNLDNCNQHITAESSDELTDRTAVDSALVPSQELIYGPQLPTTKPTFSKNLVSATNSNPVLVSSPHVKWVEKNKKEFTQRQK